MEVKNVKKNKKKYPKINNVPKETLKKYIPDKWLEAGVTPLMFDFIFYDEDEQKINK